MSRSLSIGWPLLCIAGIALGQLVSGQSERLEDRIVLADGNVLTASVVSEDYDAVVLAQDKGQKTIPWEEVRTITFADGEILTNAVGSFAGGRMDECLQILEPLLADGETRAPLQQRALYFQSLALLRGGHHEEAALALKSLLERFPKGRYLRAGGNALIELHAAKGDLPGAAKAIEEWIAGGKAAEGFAKEAPLLTARLAEAQGKFADARGLYDSVASASGVARTAAEEGRLGKARMLAQEGKVAEALPIFDALKNEASAAHVLAGAWNGLGDAWREEGRRKRDLDKLKDSVFAYLRGVVHYPPEPGADRAEYEHSLAGAMLAFKDQSEILVAKDQKAAARARFEERRRILEREFPDSPWLAKLQ